MIIQLAMAGAKRFEELVAWQNARILVQEAYTVCRDVNAGRDFGFCDQLTRAAVSSMSNIAEGFERASPKEFSRFLSISISSCAEVRSLTYVALDLGYIQQERFETIHEISNKTAMLTKALRRSVDSYSKRAYGMAQSEPSPEI